LEVTFTQFPGEGEDRGGLATERGLGLAVVAEEEDSLAAKAVDRGSLCSSNSEIVQKTTKHFVAN